MRCETCNEVGGILCRTDDHHIHCLDCNFAAWFDDIIGGLYRDLDGFMRGLCK